MTLLKWVHIFCGSLLLLLGLIQLISAKRGERHRNIGRIYFVLMWVTGLSAVTISFYRIFDDGRYSQIFLLVIGLFSIYLVTSGFLTARLKNNEGRKLLALPLGGWLISLLLLLLAMYFISRHAFAAALVCSVFGVIQGLFAWQDFRFFIQNKKIAMYGATTWTALHIGRMMGSYIAATTAFLVNAVDTGPVWLKWLGPTIIGSFFIVYFSRNYRSRRSDDTTHQKNLG